MPLRVLDLTDELAFQGARLLVGLGADVIRVDDGGALGLAARVHWHAGKRWVTRCCATLSPGRSGTRASWPG